MDISEALRQRQPGWEPPGTVKLESHASRSLPEPGTPPPPLSPESSPRVVELDAPPPGSTPLTASNNQPLPVKAEPGLQEQEEPTAAELQEAQTALDDPFRFIENLFRLGTESGQRSPPSASRRSLSPLPRSRSESPLRDPRLLEVDQFVNEWPQRFPSPSRSPSPPQRRSRSVSPRHSRSPSLPPDHSEGGDETEESDEEDEEYYPPSDYEEPVLREVLTSYGPGRSCTGKQQWLAAERNVCQWP